MIDTARLFDLVRYARGDLHDAGLITDEEFSEILTTDSINSVKRLELYDEVRAKLAAAKADVARLTDERDRALAGARASDDERAQAVESMREATAEVERLKGVIARTAEELRDKQHEDDLVVASRDAEIERLKGILRDVVTEAGGLAAPGVSTDFLSHAPAEVRGVIARHRTALRETREAWSPVWARVVKPSRSGDGRLLSVTTQDVMIQASEIEQIESVLARYAGLAREEGKEGKG